MPAPSDPTPTAQGNLLETPFAHILVYVYRRSNSSGTLLLRSEPGEAKIRVQRGRPIMARVPWSARYLFDALLPLCGLRDGVYAFYDEDRLTGELGTISGNVDPYTLIGASLDNYAREDAIDNVLQRYAGMRLRMPPNREIERLRLDPRDRPFIELIRAAPATLEELLAQSPLANVRARRVLYALIITQMVLPHDEQTQNTSRSQSLPTIAREAIPAAPPQPRRRSSPAWRVLASLRPDLSVRMDTGSLRPEASPSGKPSTISTTPPTGGSSLRASATAPGNNANTVRPVAPGPGNYANTVRPAGPTAQGSANTVRPSGPAGPASHVNTLRPSRPASSNLGSSSRPSGPAGATSSARPAGAAATGAITSLRPAGAATGATTSLRPAGPVPSPTSGAPASPTSGAPSSHAPDDSIAARIRRVEILMQRLRHDEALTEIDAMLQLEPQRAELHGLRAHTLFEKHADGEGLPRAVIDALKRALEIDPDETRALFTRGLVCKRGGDLKKALTYFKRVLQIDPKHMDAQRELRLAKLRE